jgi:hypothetical protein
VTLADLLDRLTALAEKVDQEDRRVLFEAMRRLRHPEGYVIKVNIPDRGEGG